jgi:hypothetical protein
MISTPSLIVIVLIALAGLAYMGLPLFRREDERTENEIVQKQLEYLLFYYEQVMATLRDIEEDHVTGKLNDADYNDEREAWAARGVKVLAAINQINEQMPQSVPTEDNASTNSRKRTTRSEADIDAAIEAAISKAMGAK